MKPAYAPQLHVRIIDFATANSYVAQFHRHCGPVPGHKFSLGGYSVNELSSDIWRLHAVCIVGRPIARILDNGHTLEVRRLVCAPHAPPNMCSMLLGAARRLAKKIGITRLITYTLNSESGISLRAAGWKPVHMTRGGAWTRRSRPRNATLSTGKKIRWEAPA